MPTGVYIRIKKIGGWKIKDTTKFKGRIPWNKGLKYKNTKISEALKGKPTWNKGKIGWNKGTNAGFQKGHKSFVPKESNLLAGVKRSGDKHWNWKGGITSENRLFRCKAQWKIWRGDVFERDKYTCQECGAKGVYLEPHHINPIRLNKIKAFDINNGITLCRPCHIKTMWKESNFVEKYSILVAAQNK